MDQKELVDKIVKEVMNRISQTATGGSSNNFSSAGVKSATGIIVNVPADLAQFIDHTLLKQDATKEEIEKLCKEAIEYKFYSVCVNSSWVPLCAKLLRGSGVKIASVVGFRWAPWTRERRHLKRGTPSRTGRTRSIW